MTIETIYILRHGFRLNWVSTNWKSATGQPRDPPLAAFGEVQAKEVAEYFLNLPEDERPTALWSSPYYRCIQTLGPTSEALGLPIYIEHGLSEWYSPVEPGTGLHPRPGSSVSLKAYFPRIDTDGWSTVWYPSRKGEDVDEVHARAENLLRTLVPEAERRLGSRHKRVLFMTHAATVIALVHGLIGDRTLPLRAGCCSLTRVERKIGHEGIVGGWVPTVLVDGGHLKEGLQRDWGFEDIQIARGKVINDNGEFGKDEEDFPVGCQLPSELVSRM